MAASVADPSRSRRRRPWRRSVVGSGEDSAVAEEAASAVVVVVALVEAEEVVGSVVDVREVSSRRVEATAVMVTELGKLFFRLRRASC